MLNINLEEVEDIKGIGVVVALVMVFVIVAGGISAYIILGEAETIKEGNVMVNANGKMIEVNPEASVEETGDDYRIECDKTLYTGFDSITLYCDIENLLDVNSKEDITFFFAPEQATINKFYTWDSDAESGEYCNKYIKTEYCTPVNTSNTHTCYTLESCSQYKKEYNGAWISNPKKEDKKLKDIHFGKLETIKFKIIINIEPHSTGKFDIMSGDTTLDPWWDTGYVFRQQILENKTYRSVALVNDKTGIGGNWIWADTWNDSYACTKLSVNYNDLIIANETTEKYWENATSMSGNEVHKMWQENNYEAVWHYNTNFTTDSAYGGYSESVGLGDPSIETTQSVFGGSSLYLDGNDYVEIADNSRLGGWATTTISVWFYPTTLNKQIIYRKSISGTAAYGLMIETDQYMDGFIKTDVSQVVTTSATTKPTINTWNHGVLQYNGTHQCMWLNGVKVHCPAQTGDVADGTDALRVGYYVPAAPLHFTGYIDEFRIMNTSLTDTQVLNLYYEGTTGNMSSLGAEERAGGLAYNSETYNTSVIETTTNNFEINISTRPAKNVIDITGELIFNGTNYTTTTMINTSTSNYVFDKDITLPLALVNNTSIDFYWNFNIFYDDSTSDIGIVSDTHPIGHTWAYYFENTNTTPTSVVALDSTKTQTTLVKENTAATLINIQLRFNNTTYTPSNTGLYYYKSLATPNVAADSSIKFNYTMDVVYNGTTITRSSDVGTVDVLAIAVTDCTSGVPILQYFYYDEDDTTKAVNVSKQVTYKVWKNDADIYNEFAFDLAANQSHTICMTPNYTSLYIFSTEVYGNTTGDIDGQVYPQRKYHILCELFDNTTTTINNYLINASVAQVTSVQVVDGADVPIEEAIVNARRYYVGENIFRTVAMAQTDANGESTLRLIPSTEDVDIFYDFQIYEECSLTSSFNKMNIVGTSITFPVVPTPDAVYWDTWADIDWSCNFDNTTQILTCEYQYTDDEDGNDMELMSLYVVESNATNGNVEMCNTTSSSLSTTLLCDLSGMTTETYNYWFYTTYDGEDILLEFSTLQNLAAPLFAEFGIMIAAIMLIGISLIGFNDPKLMIVLSVVAVGINYLIGFTTGTWTGVVALAIAAGLILYKG